MNRGWIVNNVLDPGFDLSCSGAQCEFDVGAGDEQKEAWKKEARKFATVGLHFAKKLYGEGNSRTKLWEERGANPMRFYFNYNRHKL